MSSDLPPDDIRKVWQNHQEKGGKMSLDEIRQKANKFDNRIRRRNLAEYLGALFLSALVAFGLYENVIRRSFLGYVASGLVVAACVFVGYELRRRGSAGSRPADCGLKCCIDFHRTELERQRDLLHRIWLWYLGPFVPGMLMFLVVIPAAAQNPPFPHHGFSFVMNLIVLSLIVFWIWKVNQRAARRLQQQIDDLNAIAAENSGGGK